MTISKDNPGRARLVHQAGCKVEAPARVVENAGVSIRRVTDPRATPTPNF